MPRARSKSPKSSEARRAAPASKGPKPSMDPYALLGVATALTLLDTKNAIAQLVAGAITSSLRSPFGAVLLVDDAVAVNAVVARLDDAAAPDPLTREMADLPNSAGEFDVQDSALPRAAEAGLRRLLRIELGTLQAKFGAVIAGTRSNQPYTAEQRAALETVGSQASIALQRIEAEAARKEAQEQLVQQMRELAVLEERSRFAHEIHDTIAQSLIAIIMALDLAERMLAADSAGAEREMDRAKSMAREALEEARRAVLALRPSGVERVSLDKAVTREIESLSDAGIAAHVSISGTAVPLSGEAEAALFRISQEAVANIGKHAAASRVDAALDYGPDAVTLTIADDGRGFDVASLPPPSEQGGFGTTSMRERAAVLGGELHIDSEPGHGTRVVVTIPYQGRAAPAATVAETAPSPTEKPVIRVLIADDHSVTRQGIRRMLEEADDIEVVAEAADGIEALEKARAYRPDVLAADMEMPGRTGIELVEALIAEGLPCRTLILTAHLQGDLIVNAMKAGAKGYLLKDAPIADLIGAVRAVHRGEIFLQRAAASELARKVSVADADSTMALTSRELEVLGLLTKGLRNKEIARDLGLSEPTVRFHVSHVLEKLEVGSRTEAVTKALRLGIISQP